MSANIRMTKEPFGKECKICQKPFNVYRWKPKIPDGDARYKKTEICPDCAKEKNVCQTCLLDLMHGLPVQVRDSLYSGTGGVEASDPSVPKSVVNIDYHFALNRMREETEPGSGENKKAPSLISEPVKDAIAALSHSTPYYKRNKAHICSFWVKGECKRGDECPYLHEMPKTGPLSKQNFKDRYFGVDDPVAEKMLGKLKENGTLPQTTSRSAVSDVFTPPSDGTIKSIWIVGIEESGRKKEECEKAIKEAFQRFGAIERVYYLTGKASAIVTFVSRSIAEAAMVKIREEGKGRAAVPFEGKEIRIRWGQASKKDSKPVSAKPYSSMDPSYLGGRKDYD
ncbi:pre-mRNA-splicing factor RBM22/SLT11 [Monocercomonoides exilis]|uniref:pre-mRNA-splicing factor RBM22/SLT11 n=1 Tax=Monocercomonoides exilis TaxID=2049356 RepID=UPI00355A316E|nr:pre-mRNA-splicing factor RBM22/SLT11 [Monocercomonoides exilis]|eukprot:MONOS_10314.1-p1 / transcript=MONOS_10314.1 / gene=MONOS_10314 / organism=Monocercomonoides_exilis_PA203 / gene_product=pre-mRNA-splicing factor RBM22/SLT11 / transcript_product=pre-mRNA-splicing factor RBM22/SLT11 / location=Mono_scaffold00464:4180-5440(-) / protein_length=339 / sequence_SO=supercontig / SO=protein_coding / is_pseudo=false